MGGCALHSPTMPQPWINSPSHRLNGEGGYPLEQRSITSQSDKLAPGYGSNSCIQASDPACCRFLYQLVIWLAGMREWDWPMHKPLPLKPTAGRKLVSRVLSPAVMQEWQTEDASGRPQSEIRTHGGVDVMVTCHRHWSNCVCILRAAHFRDIAAPLPPPNPGKGEKSCLCVRRLLAGHCLSKKLGLGF